jgi:hypothetical protein
MTTLLPRFTAVCLVPVLAACGNADAPPVTDEAPAAAPAWSVSIVEPAEGAAVEGPDLSVRLSASCVRIVPAGEIQEGTGHHHICLDADLGAPGVPVPTEPGRIIHLGDGSDAYTFEGVAPGEHRLIAVVADGMHVPLQPWVVDTVRVTVR